MMKVKDRDVDAPGAPDTRHPIVSAALAAHGETPENVRANGMWESCIRQHFIREGLPSVSCAPGYTTVHMPSPLVDDQIVFYMHEDDRDVRTSPWMNQLEFRNWMPPDVVAAALPGRTLEELIDIPGGAGLRIVDVDEKVHSLILTLAPYDSADRAEMRR